MQYRNDNSNPLIFTIMEKKNRSKLRIVVEDIMKPLVEDYTLSYLKVDRWRSEEGEYKFFVRGRINHMSGYQFAHLLSREETFFVGNCYLTYIIKA